MFDEGEAMTLITLLLLMEGFDRALLKPSCEGESDKLLEELVLPSVCFGVLHKIDISSMSSTVRSSTSGLTGGIIELSRRALGA